MKRLFLIAALGGFSILNVSAQEPAAILKNGALTVSTGNYEATFSFGHRWNLSSLAYEGVSVVVPGGANQFVVKGLNDAGQGAWYGGLGNAEEIQSVTLHIDGESYPLDSGGPGENRRFGSGESYAIEKVTKTGPYEVTIRTTVDPAGVTEKVRFSAVADTAGVDFLYPSRFSFGESFSSWFAILEDDVEEDGEVGSKGRTSINRWTEGLAVYAKSNGYVILLRTIEESRDLEPTHFLWNTGPRITFHAKLPAVAKSSGTISISRHLSVVNLGQDGGDWREQLRKTLQEAKSSSKISPK